MSAEEIFEEISKNTLRPYFQSDLNQLPAILKPAVFRMVEDFAAQQTKELSELLPDSFYANETLEHRIKMMIDIWNRSVKVAQELQKENERLKESLNKIDNLIGNYMHNDGVKIGTLVLDIQEIAVKT